MERMKSLYTGSLRVLLVSMLTLLLAVMTVQVALRYGFSTSLIWAEELCRYLLIWASFLAVALAYERGELSAVTILRDRLPRRAGLALAMVNNLLGIGLLVTLVIYGFRYAERIGHQPVPALRFLFNDLFGPGVVTVPSMFWVFAALPVGLTLLALRLAVDLAHYAALWRAGGHAADLRRSAAGAEAHA